MSSVRIIKQTKDLSNNYNHGIALDVIFDRWTSTVVKRRFHVLDGEVETKTDSREREIYRQMSTLLRDVSQDRS